MKEEIIGQPYIDMSWDQCKKIENSEELKVKYQ